MKFTQRAQNAQSPSQIKNDFSALVLACDIILSLLAGLPAGLPATTN